MCVVFIHLDLLLPHIIVCVKDYVRNVRNVRNVHYPHECVVRTRFWCAYASGDIDIDPTRQGEIDFPHKRAERFVDSMLTRCCVTRCYGNALLTRRLAE